KSHRADVGKRWLVGNGRVGGQLIQSRYPTACGDGIAIDPPWIGPADEEEVLQVLDVAGQSNRGSRAAGDEKGIVTSRAGSAHPAHKVRGCHVTNASGESIDERDDLIRLKEQVTRFAHDVAVFLLQFQVLARIAARHAGIIKNAVVHHVLSAIPRWA